MIMLTKSQLGWLNLPHLPILLPPMTAKQRVVIIPRDQSEEGIDGYGRKDFEKDESGKCHEKGQQVVQEQNITIEKSSVMTKDRTDREHKHEK